MSKYDCEICHGNGRIRLPRYVRLKAVGGPSPMDAEIESSVAEFACPECEANSAPFDRVDVVSQIVSAASDIRDARFDEHVKERLSYDLARELLRRGLITFQQGRENLKDMTVPWKATIGAVAPKHVATMEDRISARQLEVAAEVVAQTGEEIANWGSYYHGREGGSVGKWQALDWLAEAFKKVKAARAQAPR